MEAQPVETVPQEVAVVSQPQQGNRLTVTLNFNDEALHVFGSVEKPLFKETEICKFLGLSLKHVAQKTSNLLPHEKLEMQLPDINGRTQTYLMVRESAVVKMAFKSNKPQAEAFTQFVAEEVIPSIRRTGAYVVPSAAPPVSPRLKRKREDIELVKEELALWERIERTEGLEPRDKIAYKDRIRSLNAPLEALAIEGPAPAPADPEIPISLWLSRNSVKNQSRGTLIKMGTAISRAYKAKYGTKPVKRIQYVDGAARDVCHYTQSQWELGSMPPTRSHRASSSLTSSISSRFRLRLGAAEGAT